MKTTYILLACLCLFGCNKEDLPQPEPQVHASAIGDAHLTIQTVSGKKRIYWSDGVQAILSHADSPEGGLNTAWYTADAQYSQAVARRGINARTWTLRGDDVTSIQPGDINKMRQWKTQFLVFINACKSVDIRPVCILYIGERTNFNRSLSEYQGWLSLFAQVMKEGEDITGYFSIGIEEVGQTMSDNQVASFWNPLNAYIKSIMPRCITFLHNNPGKKFWRATSPALQVDVIHVQETSIGNMESSANDALNRGFAIHLHEWYGAIKASQSNSTNISKLDQQLAVAQRTGCKCSGIFANDIDTQKPDTNKLKAVHVHQGNYFYGSIQPPDDTIAPPPSGSLSLYYSTSAQTNANRLDSNEVLQAGGYNLFIPTAQGSAPVVFTLKKNGSQVLARTENIAPFDHNGGGNYNFTAGSWSIRVQTAGQTKEIPFTVGTVQPPDDTIVPTTYALKISTSANRSGATILNNGATITTGNKYIFVDGVTTATQSGWQISLWKGGVMQTGYPRGENVLPIDVKGTDGSNAMPQNFTAGSWRLRITKSGAAVFDVTFTVQ